MGKKDQWKSSLRSKMADYSEPEPEGLWEGISSQISAIEDAGKKSVRMRRTVRAVLIPVAAAAALAAFFFFRTNNENTLPAGNDTMAGTYSKDTGDIRVIPRDDRPGQEWELTAMADRDKIAPVPETSPHTDPVYNDIESQSMEEPAPEQDHAGTPSGQKSVETSPDRQQGKPENSGKDPESWKHTSGLEDDLQGLRSRSHGRGRFSTDIFISNLAGSSQKFNGFGTYQPQAMAFKGIPAKDAISTLPGNGIMLLTHEEESSTEVRHRQPVRAGVSFRYNFTRRWGIETGLVYSFLSSEMESGNRDQYSSTTEQTLHYIGIPLKASYSFLDRKHFTLYASAGGMVEKCIYGKVRSGSSIGGMDTVISEDRVSIRPLQWSVSAEAGVQWNITPLLGIYAEPGVSWHFDNGSMVSTIYKEKPFNFNLEFGLRFSFE